VGGGALLCPPPPHTHTHTNVPLPRSLSWVKVHCGPRRGRGCQAGGPTHPAPRVCSVPPVPLRQRWGRHGCGVPCPGGECMLGSSGHVIVRVVCCCCCGFGSVWLQLTYWVPPNPCPVSYADPFGRTWCGASPVNRVLRSPHPPPPPPRYSLLCWRHWGGSQPQRQPTHAHMLVSPVRHRVPARDGVRGRARCVCVAGGRGGGSGACLTRRPGLRTPPTLATAWHLGLAGPPPRPRSCRGTPSPRPQG
jgi:hypothetical protein